MSTLSIRKLPRDVEQALRRETRRQRKSKTDVVVHLLKEAFHLSTQEHRARRLQQFFGSVSPADLAALDEAVQDFEKIDEELWR